MLTEPFLISFNTAPSSDATMFSSNTPKRILFSIPLINLASVPALPPHKNSTKLSADSLGMYFDFYMSSLPKGRSYVFDFLIKKNGFDTVINDAASKFRVEWKKGLAYV